MSDLMKPRSRLVRYEFFTDESVASLDYLTRLLFIGLWTLTDREGRLEYKPREIRAQLMSYEEDIKTTDVVKMLTKLEEAGMIIRYSVEGVEFAWMPNFTKHQSFHRNESPSCIPVPPEDILTRSLLEPCKTLTRAQQESSGNNNNRNSNKGNNKNKIPEIVTLVLDDLNLVLGSNYKDTTGPYQLMILKREKEGFTLEDFKAVHRGQYKEWAHDPKMSKYLTPATLYRIGHFPKYVENARRPEPVQLSDASKNQLTAAAKFVARGQGEISHDGSN